MHSIDTSNENELINESLQDTQQNEDDSVEGDSTVGEEEDHTSDVATPQKSSFSDLHLQQKRASAHLLQAADELGAQSPVSPASKALDKEGNIKVCVRLRPFNNRELKSHCKRVVEYLDEHTVRIRHPEKKEKDWKFSYDRLYWSFDNSKRRLATQDYIFKDMGRKLVQHAIDGYNATLIAYGQTGSGKTHTIFGPDLSKDVDKSEELRKEGLVPRICREIFSKLQKLDAERDLNESNSSVHAENGPIDPEQKISNTSHVYFRMMEIYQERVKDLLNPQNHNIKVSITNEGDNKRNIHISAPMQIVHSFKDIARLIEKGNQEKQIAETKMNARSSRSHTIFQIRMEQPAPGNKKRVSILNLVDLAGSENAKLAATSGNTLKEGASINKSLSALGHVIDELVAKQNKKKKKKKGKKGSSGFVSYRNSMLTSILANSLGGNAKTFMLCCLAPSDMSFAATKSTLRYGQKTKQIRNKAVVNEDSNVKLIRELKANIEELKKQIQEGGASHSDVRNLQDQLEESKLIQQQLAATVEEHERTQYELEELRQKLMNEETEKHKQKVLIEQLRSEKLASKRNASIQTVVDMERANSIDEVSQIEISSDLEQVHSDSSSEEDLNEERHMHDSASDSSSDMSSQSDTDSSFDDFEIAEVGDEADEMLSAMEASAPTDAESFKVPMDIDNMEVGGADSESPFSSEDEAQPFNDNIRDEQQDPAPSFQDESHQDEKQEHAQAASQQTADSIDTHNIHIEVPSDEENGPSGMRNSVHLVEEPSAGMTTQQTSPPVQHKSASTTWSIQDTEDVAVSPVAMLRQHRQTQMTPKNRSSASMKPPRDDAQFAIRLMVESVLRDLEARYYTDLLEETLEEHHNRLLAEQQRYKQLQSEYDNLSKSRSDYEEKHRKTESLLAETKSQTSATIENWKVRYEETQRMLEEANQSQDEDDDTPDKKKKKKKRCAVM